MSFLSDLPPWIEYPDPDIYNWGKPVFLDFETTNLSKGSALDPRNRLVLSVWQVGWDGTPKVSWGNEYELEELVRNVNENEFLVAHNAKFELQWLARCGLDLGRALVYDTMLAEYVIGGNRWTLGKLGLDTCLRRRKLGGKEAVVSRMIKAGICPSEIPAEWLEEYCRRDVAVLQDLMRAQLADMKGTRLLPVVFNRCALTPVLADIETNGMHLDSDLVRTEFDELSKVYKELEAKLNTLTGGINFRSRKQLAEFLYDKLEFAELTVKKGRQWEPKRTPGGDRATDTDTLATLKATTPAQREFKELYTRLNATSQALSKYMTKFKDCVDKAGGVLYGNFNQTNTQTHRLSSTGREYSAQFQNFPRAYKPLFSAGRSGNLIAEVDGAQLEFRVAAHLGRDHSALADIEAGTDVHSYTATVLTEAGQPTNRQGAKEHTFKPLYGGQSGTEAEQEYYRAFREKYPEIAETQRKWVAHVLEHKYLETEWGLRYYWPDTRMDRSGYITNTTSICNYPVQAFATAEIIPAALVLMWHVVRKRKLPITLINTVHDSIIAEITPNAVEDFHEVARWCLIDGVYMYIRELYGIEIICPLGCGIKVASHWGATKDETKYEADAYLYKEETA